MRTQAQFLGAYAQSHRNEANQVIHYICVPVIFFSTLGLLWAIPIGRWLGLPDDVAPWANIVTLGFIPVALFYLSLSVTGFLTMMLWFGGSVLGIVAIQDAWGVRWLVAICAGLWIAAWVLQFYGHKLEGTKPSFIEDLVFLLIGPLFVMDKALRGIGRKGL